MDTVTSADGTIIAFDRVGSGPAVVLVGGAFQYRAADPRTGELASLLAERFTVYHYDRRGRGDSTDTQPYAPAREFEDLAAVVDHAGGTAHVFGMSSGAVLALDAVAGGVKAASVAVYEPPVLAAEGIRPPLPADYLARLRAHVAAGRRDETVQQFLAEGVGVPEPVVAQMRGSAGWAAMTAIAPTLAYDAAVVDEVTRGTPIPASRWASITVPVLVVHGGATSAHLAHGAETVAGLIPHATQGELPGQDHAYDPKRLAPVLAGFFDQ